MSTASVARPNEDDNGPVSGTFDGQGKRASPAFLHSPPDSNNAPKSDATDSELSDLDEEPVLPQSTESKHSSIPPPNQDPKATSNPDNNASQEENKAEDIGEILPDHWSGAVPVFKPTMHQFKDFNRFMEKVNSYGMKSGIIKIIPPADWKDKQPRLDDLVKGVRVREPIKQDIMGSNGTYRQVNILHGRSYNVPQWRQLCDQSEHQPPARRGERRANAEKPKTQRRPAAPKPAEPSTPKRRGRKGGKKRGRQSRKTAEEDRPMTPVSPKAENRDDEDVEGDLVDSVENEVEEPVAPRRMGAVQSAKSKTQSVSARRKFSRREGSAMIDESAFKDFDYKMDISDYTPERCEELERAYWKTLTYAQPLYGADMMGTLFDDRTETWNLNKLPNLLDVLGTKIPGVNTAYLYFGMWKATFAWHLEDVDLYSINYVHFGAPKQWYSISQADARRFEGAMKSIWPHDAKACSQFLRHKGYLISPQHLLQNYGIKVNKVVSYPGEFVVTFPYGYHSGYNLGYNCAEAVNFALEPWLEMGKIAKRCECAQAQDSVWINVYEIERKLKGEETEYEETDEDDEDEEDEHDEDDSGLPSPPGSHGVKIKAPTRKRKRARNEKVPKTKVKKIKLRLKTRAEPPCALCPNDIPAMDILPTDDGRKAHRICAMYLPETYIEEVDGKEVVSNISGVHKDRTELKCLYCRSKRGACFQCSHHKCTRAYHPTCAAAAGVFIEEAEVPVYGEDQTEYKEQAFEFSCRYHRAKREKKLDGDALEDDARINGAASSLKKGDVCQFQYHKGDIFAGIVVENQADEHMLLVDILPHGERLEVEWKWLLLADPSDYHLPRASANAIPMPNSRKAKDKLNAKRSTDDKPRKDDPFTDGTTWAEFNLHEVDRNKDQVKIDFTKEDQTWHYLPRLSTEARDKYTHDPSKRVHNPKSNFLSSMPKVVKPKPPPAHKKPPPPSIPMYQQQFYQTTPASYPVNSPSASPATTAWAAPKAEKPYVYKPRKHAESHFDESRMFTQQRFSVSQQPQNLTGSYQSPHQQPSHGSPVVTHTQQQFEPKPSYHATGVQPVNMNQFRSAPHAPEPGQKPVPTSPPLGPAQQSRPDGKALSNNVQPNAPIRQNNKPAWQIHPTIYQKYPFFQVHHNRDAGRYKTPYSPWGGFINGYEGDLRAHLLANSKELLQRSSFTSMSQTTPNLSAHSNNVSPYHGPSHNQPSESSHAMSTPQSSMQQTPAHTQSQVQASPSQVPTLQTSPPPLTPHAQPAKTTTQLQTSTSASPKPDTNKPPTPGTQRTPSQAANGSKAKPVPVPKPYKIPSKQSPVPLPTNFANFRAAMTASPSSSAGPSKPSLLKASVLNGIESPNSFKSGETPHTPHQKQSPATAISIPKFAGMTPHQAAAQAGSSGAAFNTTNKVSEIPYTESGRPQDTATQSKHVSLSTEGFPSQSPVPLPWQPQSSSTGVTQEFPDVPGSESMEFMENMMRNLRRVAEMGHHSA